MEDEPELGGVESKENIKKRFLSAEETPVLGKFGEKWCSSLLELKKWNEKRDKLQKLLRAITVEKIKSENFTQRNKL